MKKHQLKLINLLSHQSSHPKSLKKKTEITAVVSPLLQQLDEGPETVVEPKKSKRAKESMWLALGGSAGNFTPNTPTATTPTVTQSSFDAKGPALAFSTIATTEASTESRLILFCWHRCG
ncbi:MAG: hypothetical protein WDO15_17560 [Bacteroidota bacterium]